MLHTTLQQFLPAIRTLRNDKPLIREELISASFLVKKDGELEMYYAPHNEYINKQAEIVIIGITPGWSQMKAAFEQFIKDLSSGYPLITCLFHSKKAARFAGSMRRNLFQMLDDCNIPEVLNIHHAADLFGKSEHLLHTTSVIKYPVFLKGQNYNGYQPPIDRSPLLKYYAYHVFPNELAQITPNALIIPLGKSVEQVVLRLLKENKIPHHEYLFGFPHPSGANGHRTKQFQERKHLLRKRINRWAQGKKIE